jgi:hypothetical protein
MPSRWVQDIYEGTMTTVDAYAVHCLQAFGVDAPYPKDYTPDLQWFDDEIAKIATRISALHQMSYEECKAQAGAQFDTQMLMYGRDQSWRQVVKGRCDRMLRQLKEWEPSEVLAGLKQFMICELQEALLNDCDLSVLPPVPLLRQPEAWRQHTISKLQIDVMNLEAQKKSTVYNAQRRNDLLKAFNATVFPALEIRHG